MSGFQFFLLRQEPQITICLKVSADAKTKNLNLVNGISLILNYMSSLNLIYLDVFDIHITFLRLKLQVLAYSKIQIQLFHSCHWA